MQQEYIRIQMRDGSWGRIYPHRLAVKINHSVYQALRAFAVSATVLAVMMLAVL